MIVLWSKFICVIFDMLYDVSDIAMQEVAEIILNLQTSFADLK